MDEISVRIEELKPMRVACVRVKSTTPETDAWEILSSWAGPKDMLNDPVNHPVYGYTISNPEQNEPEYSYEFWMTIDDDTEVGGDIKELMFAGGWYAVMTHQGPPYPEVWMRLWEWVQSSPYTWRKTHELEHPRNPLAQEKDMLFDLFLPIDIGAE